jgi:hypothetical protein
LSCLIIPVSFCKLCIPFCHKDECIMCLRCIRTLLPDYTV